jgi:hypothetical protein
MSLIGGLAGLTGLAIGATAALVTIDATTKMLRCTNCGYTHKNKQVVMNHVRRHMRQRQRPTSWVY